MKIIIVFGNLVVMFTVVYRKQIRTARNILIFNLALSDLLLGMLISSKVCHQVNYVHLEADP